MANVQSNTQLYLLAMSGWIT